MVFNLRWVVLALLGLAPAALNAFPQPKGRVNDFASVLKASTRESLERDIAALEHQFGAEVAVVTVPSLDGKNIELYANQLFNTWGVGKKGRNNGVLILIAPNERRMRIEVGYGLEPILPDGLAGEIIRDQMTPAFKAGDMDRGVIAGTERVLAIIKAQQPLPKSYQAPMSLSDQIGAAILCSLLILLGGIALGTGIGSKTVIPILIGFPFLAVSLFIVAASLNSFAQILLCAEFLTIMIWYYRKGREASRWVYNTKRRRYARVWSFTGNFGGSSRSSGGSSSDSGGGFGGGSSGGGGASGSW